MRKERTNAFLLNYTFKDITTILLCCYPFNGCPVIPCIRGLYRMSRNFGDNLSSNFTNEQNSDNKGLWKLTDCRAFEYCLIGEGKTFQCNTYICSIS